MNVRQSIKIIAIFLVLVLYIGVLSSNAEMSLGTSNVRQSGTWNIGTVTTLTDITNAIKAIGNIAHDSVGTGSNPLLIGCYSSAAAPVDVTADGDATRSWCLRNGAIAIQPTFSGVLASVGNGVSGTGVQRVTIASDSTGTIIATQATAANLNNRSDTSGATGAAPPARADFVGGLTSGATGGFVTGITVCDSFVNVTVSTATTTLLITGVTGRHVRICSLSLVTAAANNVALISGTGATCATGTTGMNGGTTAATGWNFAANGGLTQGSGLGEVNRTNATGNSVCIITSAATQLSGRISYAIY